MLDAERANRRDAARFVYREEIRFRQMLADGTTRRDSRVTYEVSMLEGEPYHRRVAVNGEPLAAELAELEERRMREVEAFRRVTPYDERRRAHFAAEEERFKIDSRLVLEHHELRLLGETVVEGRKAWLVEAVPRRGTPKPKRRSEWSLSQKIRYTIDQETAFPMHVEAEQLFDVDVAMKGSLTILDYHQVEGVWLIYTIESRGTRKTGRQKLTVVTEQTYSAYKRFSADSVLIFEDEESRQRPPKQD